MRCILVLGVDTLSKSPWGGVIDIDALGNTTDEQYLAQAIDGALKDPRPSWLSPTDPWIGTAVAPLSVTNLTQKFEPMPFTGTIEREVILFLE